MTKIPVTRAETLKPHPDESELGFGTVFTDHMLSMDYHPGQGWHDPRIEPYGPLPVEPATMVLHYAQAIFDGHKAYRTPAGTVQLFRPQAHLARLNRSARRMCIPEIDEALALDALKQLIALEQAWVPSAPGTSLYIRPMVLPWIAAWGACITNLPLLHLPVASRALLRRRLPASQNLGLERARAGLPRRAGRDQDTGELCGEPASPRSRRGAKAIRRCCGSMAWSTVTSKRSAR